MDSTKGQSQIQVDAIMARLRNGDINREELEATILAEIDREAHKPSEEVDTEYIDDCLKLYEQIRSPEQPKPESFGNENLNAVLTRLHKQNRKKDGRRMPRFAFRCVIVMASLALIIVTADRVLRFNWLQGTVSPDEEQLIIQSNAFSPNLVPNAGADHDPEEIKRLTTKDAQEAIQFWGEALLLPTAVPEGWQVNEYNVSMSSFSRDFSITYVKEGEDYLLCYDYMLYPDNGVRRTELEQNAYGEDVVLENGQSVYFAMNINNAIAVWFPLNMQQCVLTGPISMEEMTMIILSITNANESGG